MSVEGDRNGVVAISLVRMESAEKVFRTGFYSCAARELALLADLRKEARGKYI